MSLIPEAQQQTINTSCWIHLSKEYNVEYFSLSGIYAVPAGKITDFCFTFVAFICTVKQSENSKVTLRFTYAHRYSMEFY